MRHLLALALAVTVLSGIPTAAQETGRVQVTAPPGLRVYVDGRIAGKTTDADDGIFLERVAAGERTIRLEKQGFDPEERKVTVPAGGIVEVRIDALRPASPKPTTTTVEVSVEPADAMVFLDGLLYGRGPCTIQDIEAGQHVIVVAREGYADHEKRITVHANQSQQVEARLRKGRSSILSQPQGTKGIVAHAGRGFLDVTFPGSREDIHRRLGRPEKESSESGFLWMSYRTAHGLDFLVAENGNGDIAEMRFNPGFEGKLAQGLGIGSSCEDIFVSFGQPSRRVETSTFEGCFDDRTFYHNSTASKIIYMDAGVLFWFDPRGLVAQFVLFKPARNAPRQLPDENRGDEPLRGEDHAGDPAPKVEQMWFTEVLDNFANHRGKTVQFSCYVVDAGYDNNGGAQVYVTKSYSPEDVNAEEMAVFSVTKVYFDANQRLFLGAIDSPTAIELTVKLAMSQPSLDELRKPWGEVVGISRK
ncbi:MAG: PEGA domain-containing protein [Planctomycetes bacterium]|nr:PEGA domain-containing protein [Planctomycetota bacterium]